MEKRIREYEKFIEKAAKNPSKELWDLHRATVLNFQHERLIHLIIMLFFIVVTLGVLILDAVSMSMIHYKLWLRADMLPLHILALLLVILSVAYVKHYHFLENHIQKLYDYDRKLKKM